MFRTALAATLTLAALSAPSLANNQQLKQLVSAELPHYVRGVDVDTLSNHQISTIYSIMHGPKSQSAKAGMIRSTLGGQYSLRSLIFK